jgi:glycosyltransferase involved in cell wall biosynthesis
LVAPFYKKIWKKHIEKFVTENKIDIIHIHDLPMTDIVHSVAEKYDCKVVCDQHEYWSNWIVNTKHYNTIPGKIIKSLSDWTGYEKKNLKKAHLVITVSDSLRECYIKEVGLDSGKVISVPNTPTRTIFKKENVDPQIIQKYKTNFVIFYAGAIDILRGLDLIIDSLPKIEAEIPSVKFVIAGKISKGCDPLEMADRNGVTHLVEFVGWLDLVQLPSYISAAKICVFTPYASHNEINNTIATKIYQYLAMHKPIITSQAKMMHDFVVNNQIGFAVHTDDKKGFAQTVIKLYKNYKSEAYRIANNSKALLQKEDIFWDQTVRSMLEAYNKL